MNRRREGERESERELQNIEGPNQNNGRSMCYVAWQAPGHIAPKAPSIQSPGHIAPKAPSAMASPIFVLRTLTRP